MTTNPLLILIINMTVVFFVLFVLELLTESTTSTPRVKTPGEVNQMTTNPLLILIINMTVVFFVLFVLELLTRGIYYIDPTRKEGCDTGYC